MTRTTFIILAALSLGLPTSAAAQNNAAPATVVTPAPPPREGTVGPEQLRDFALPGSRRASSPPPAETRPAPASTERRDTAPATVRPAPAAPVRAEPRPEPARSPSRRQAAEAPDPASPAAPSPAQRSAPLPRATPAITAPLPLPQAGDRLPPISVTQSGTEAPSLLPAWWPWLLVAMLAGVGLALFRRQRGRAAVAGHGAGRFDFAGAEPASPAPNPQPALKPRSASRPQPAPRPAPKPAPQPAAALPTGLVTTRLRSATAPAPAPAPPAAVPGGVVSRRLRGWVEIDLLLREILLDAEGALLRFDLVISNVGTAAARDIALEAVAVNAGEQQEAELAAFFARPGAAAVAIPELRPLGETSISHQLRLPRSAIRAYEAQGRTLFVPVVALNAVYRTAASEGRTGAAFLVGRELPGAEKLAPLVLMEGSGRLLGLGVRRLDQVVRR